jgi:hypothetical protein
MDTGRAVPSSESDAAGGNPANIAASGSEQSKERDARAAAKAGLCPNG